MNTTVIEPAAQPEDQRYTTHLFSDMRGYLGDPQPPLGSPLQISDTVQWPPAILFDAVYADAVIRNFGTQTLKDEVTKTWKNIFYPGGIIIVEQADCQFTVEERHQNHAQERRARYEARRGPDGLDMLRTSSCHRTSWG